MTPGMTQHQDYISRDYDATITQQKTADNCNPESDVMFKILKKLLNHVIKLVIDARYQALEKMVTEKLLAMLNTQTLNQDRV